MFMKMINIQFTLLEKYSINFNEYVLAKIIALAQVKQNAEIVHEYFSMRMCARGKVRELLSGLVSVGVINKSYKIPEPGTAFNPNDIPLDKDFMQDILNH